MAEKSPEPDQVGRRQFVADPAALAALDMRLEDLRDPDMRSLVIQQEHPELEAALDSGLDEIDLGYGPMNPRLHLVMHEVVATQLWDDSPPEVWTTAVRLLKADYERHEVLHMLMRPVSDQVWSTLHDDRPYDHARHVAALDALPGSWERERATRRLAAQHSNARQQARKRQRQARRRSRRPK
jgi:hypothetical protein